MDLGASRLETTPPGTGQYYVRDDEGVVRGPYPLETVVRLARRGASGLQVSQDGRQYVPVWLQAEVRDAMDQARGSRMRSEPPPSRTHLTPPEPDVLPPSGLLEPGGGVGRVLRIAAQGATGRLWIDSPESGGRVAAWFVDGAPRVAGELEGPFGLVTFFARRLGVTEQVSRAALAAAVGSGQVAAALAALNLESSEKFLVLLQEHAGRTFDRMLAGVTGTFSWAQGETAPPGTMRVGDRWSAVLGAWRKLTAEQARHRLGDRYDRHVRLAPDRLTQVAMLPLTPLELATVKRFDGAQTPADLSAEDLAVDDTSGRVERVAFGLVESGWGLVDDGRISVLVSDQRASGVSRAALGPGALVQVRRDWLSANHFEVLGIGRDADGPSVERAAAELRKKLRLDVVEADPALAALKAELGARVELARRTLADRRDRSIYEAMLDTPG